MVILSWLKNHSLAAGGAAAFAGILGGLIIILGPHYGNFVLPGSPPAQTSHPQAALSQTSAPAKTSSKAHTQPVAAPSPTPAPAVTPAAPSPDLIGLYVDEAPSNPASLATLDWAHSAGFNVVYNYSSIDGSVSDINTYLNHAQALGLKVIFSLKDLYDQLPNGASVASSYPQFGTTNESIALGVVRDFTNHPATWGFAITDEAPETPADLPTWQPLLLDRYYKIKNLTTKPVMSVLLGYTDDSAGARRSFLGSLRPGTDTFALDYYPIPYAPLDKTAEFAADLPAVGDTNGWSIIQDFSWASYPKTARGLGYNLGAARPPTTAEMVSMAQLALANGAHNLLFYSYFDIKNDPAQQAALKAAISQIKG